MEAELQRNALAGILRLEGGAVGGERPFLEFGRTRLVLDADGMAHEKIVVHGDDGLGGRAFGYQRQTEVDDAILLARQHRSPGHQAGVVGQAVLALGIDQRLAGGEIRGAKTVDTVSGEILPLRRFPVGSAGALPGIRERSAKGAELLRPVGFRPVLAVEMAAAMAADLMSLQMGSPEMVQAGADFTLASGEADIGASLLLSRRLIGLLRIRIHQEGTGEKIGEMRASASGERPASVPERIVMGAVEGDNDHLRPFGSGGQGGGKDGQGGQKIQKTKHSNSTQAKSGAFPGISNTRRRRLAAAFCLVNAAKL